MAATDKPTTPNGACACKRANHWHGTRACYVIDRCRCRPCKDAASAAERARLRLKAQAAWGYREDAYVDAAPAVAHIRALQAAGLGWQEVARRAGVPTASVYPLLYGRPDRNGGQPRTRCRPTTRDRILAVPIPHVEELLPGSNVTAYRTLNRVKALHGIGYSFTQIADASGVDRQVFDRLLKPSRRKVRTVRLATHLAVKATFERLWNTPYYGTDWHTRAAAARARNRAAALGWPLPIEIDEDGHAPRRRATA